MVFPKNVTILIIWHSHNFRQTITLWACLSQHLSIWVTNVQAKRCNSFLARSRTRNSLILVWEQAVTTISTPRQVWHGISWPILVHAHFRVSKHFFRPMTQIPTLIWCGVCIDRVFYETTSRAHDKCHFLQLNFPTHDKCTHCIRFDS